MTYILYSNGILEQDGFVIPSDDLNPNFQKYLTWLALGNTPILQDGSVYLAKLEQNNLDKTQFKQVYQDMLARLQQIQNAGVIPFTQAGFNQVVQAVKDEALYIERIMKVLSRIT